MKIFTSIQVGCSGDPGRSGDSGHSAPSCQRCVHFQNDPAVIEEAYRGLTAMSSGFASVRDRDGICDYHQIYLSAGDSCANFTADTAGIRK